MRIKQRDRHWLGAILRQHFDQRTGAQGITHANARYLNNAQTGKACRVIGFGTVYR